MTFLPIENLHLETFVILLFLAMVIRTELGRATEPKYDVLNGRIHWRLLPVVFLVLAAVLTRFLYDVSPLLGFELAIGLTLSLFHPVNALCFMVHLMILRPWEIGPPNPVLQLIPRCGVFLCALSYLIHSSAHSRLTKQSRRSVLYLAGFSAWLMLTAIRTPSITATLSALFDTYFKSLTLFAMALFLIENERSVREFQLTLVLSSLSLMVTGIYRFLSIGLTAGRLMSTGKLGDPNDMGALIVMALPFALIPEADEKTGPFVKIAGWVYAGLAAVVIWLTRSRGTMLAIAAQFLVFRLVRSKRNRLGLVLTAALVGGGYFGLMSIVPRQSGEMDASADSRITFWTAAVNMAVHSPVLGVGFDQFPEKYMSYATRTIYERGNRTAHSSWFLALGESGFVGFFLFCAFFLTVVRIAWRDRAKRPGQLYAVAGYAVAMSFLSHTYTPYPYILTALVLASAGVKEKVKDEA